MSELDAAQRRLNDALRRLEGALSRRLSTAPGAGLERELHAVAAERDALARDVTVLRNECDRLSNALREAQEERRNLQEVTDAVARRLDGSIGELDRMLEGRGDAHG